MSAVIIPFPARPIPDQSAWATGDGQVIHLQYDPVNLVPAVIVSAGLWAGLYALFSAIR